MPGDATQEQGHELGRAIGGGAGAACRCVLIIGEPGGSNLPSFHPVAQPMGRKHGIDGGEAEYGKEEDEL